MNDKAKSALESYRAKLAAGEIEKSERLDPLERARRNPQSKVLAIKAMCWECSGAQRDEIKNCQVKKCPLWVHRPFQ